MARPTLSSPTDAVAAWLAISLNVLLILVPGIVSTSRRRCEVQCAAGG
jgi:hypothetical protein